VTPSNEERRSRESQLARNLVITKQQIDFYEAQLEELPRWRRGERASTKDLLEAARDRERELLESLGGRRRS
jgi:hypothetical protein